MHFRNLEQYIKPPALLRSMKIIQANYRQRACFVLVLAHTAQIMFLSKMTAAVLEDLDYIVDPSEVRAIMLTTFVSNNVEIQSPTPGFELPLDPTTTNATFSCV